METPTAAPLIRARRPADVLATVPYLLGFHPRDSLVVLTLTGPKDRVAFTVRVDLPDEASRRQWAAALLAALRRNGAKRVLVVAFCADEAVAGPAVAAVRDALAAARLRLVDAWRADGHRWWSYVCTDPACCPPAGTAYDAATGPCAVQAVVNGLVALPDRETLAASVSRLPGETQQVMERITARVQDEILSRVLGCADPARSFVVQGQDAVVAYVRDFIRRPREVGEQDAARLSVWVQHLHVRDAAWCLMDVDRLDPHIDLWRQVTRRAVPGLVAAPAALLSFAAWRSGRGALAQCALDRVLADNPGYSMGALLGEVLAESLPPSAWTPMPLEELYAATRGAAPPAHEGGAA